MENMMEFIKPELLILVPVLNVIGLAIKIWCTEKTSKIPLILGLAGITLSLMWVLATQGLASRQEWFMAAFTAVVQGVLCAGLSVYANQLWRHIGADESNKKKK